MASRTEIIAMEIGDIVSAKLKMVLVDAEFKKEAGKNILRLYIDKNGGVGIDDCEAFSRAFEAEFDEQDPIEKEYVLEVSSPGVDRKLKKEREFLHYLGRQVDVKLYKALDGKKEFSGILESYDEGNLVVNIGGELLKINIKEAVYIKLHFEF